MSKCKVYAFLNDKGGVGKTSICGSLARVLAKQGEKVLLIDLDPSKNLTNMMFRKNEKEFYKMPEHRIDELIEEYLDIDDNTYIDFSKYIKQVKYKNVFMIASRHELNNLKVHIQEMYNNNYKVIPAIIDDLKSLTVSEESDAEPFYDKILIDMHPSIDIIASSVACAADCIVVPFVSGDNSAEGAISTVDFCSRFLKTKRQPYNTLKKCLLLASRFKKNEDSVSDFTTNIQAALSRGDISKNIDVQKYLDLMLKTRIEESKFIQNMDGAKKGAKLPQGNKAYQQLESLIAELGEQIGD